MLLLLSICGCGHSYCYEECSGATSKRTYQQSDGTWRMCFCDVASFTFRISENGYCADDGVQLHRDWEAFHAKYCPK